MLQLLVLIRSAIKLAAMVWAGHRFESSEEENRSQDEGISINGSVRNKRFKVPAVKDGSENVRQINWRVG
jgi:hypothetical protein